MQCPKCGTQNDDHKTVCGICGTFLYRYTQNRVPLTRAQRRKEVGQAWKQALKGTLYALLILLGLAVVLFIISLILGRVMPDSLFEGLFDTTLTTTSVG